MLSININKDVEQYQESVLAGFNAVQFIVIVLGVGAFGGTFALLHYMAGVPMMVCVYLSIIPALPIVLLGFGSKNGMSFFERLRRTLNRKKTPLFYKATEAATVYRMIEKKRPDEKEEKQEFENAKKRMKTGLFLLAGLIVLLAVCYIFLRKGGIL